MGDSQVEKRLAMLEDGMVAIQTELRDHTDALKEQTQSLNRVAASIDHVVKTVLDTRSGITPITLMQISDHQKIVRSMLFAFGMIIVIAIGVNKVGDVMKSSEIKEAVTKLTGELPQ